ncbi:MAG: hypothetical protein FWF59_04165 [Turicibacter sp.]|nr:hypothetical protein [Turicibacter sp.]
MTNNVKSLQPNEVFVADFEKNSMRAINDTKGLRYTAKNLSVSFKNGLLEATFTLRASNEEAEIHLKVLPIIESVTTEKEQVLLGREVNLTEGFKLVSYRIELNAQSLTLMPINLHLKGKHVLALGLEKTFTKELYYCQFELPLLPLKDIFDEGRINHSKFPCRELHDLSFRSITLSEPFESYFEGEIPIMEETAETIFTEDGEMDMLEFLELLEKDSSLGSLSPKGIVHANVPDSIFKSGTFGEWRHVNNATNVYSYITYRYGGTDNRITYIAYMEYANQSSGSPHQIQLTVKKNVGVYYNVTDGTLALYSTYKDRVFIKNLKLTLKSTAASGIFTSRKYWNVGSSSLLGRVAAAAIIWVPYAGSAVETLQTLSGDSSEE